jgi:endonuclease/exonuclease/phosphatase family metal-dependent hydrolase
MDTAKFVIAGDFNDTPDSLCLSALVAPGNELKCYNIIEELPDNKKARATYKNKQEQIDYILLSSALKGKLVPGSVKIGNESAYNDASDHFPVFAELEF